MSKYDFLSQITDCLKKRPEFQGVEITGGSYIHNNDTERIGIALRHGSENLAPIIYLDRYYDDYQKKKLTVEEIAEAVVSLFRDLKLRPSEEVQWLEWEDCRDRITYRLVSAELNSSYLAHIPHVNFLNLAIIFTVIYRISGDGVESIRITEELMEHWGVDVGELMKLSRVNTPKLFPARFESVLSVLGQFMDCEMDEVDDDFPMLLLSNKQAVFGATSMLYEDVVVGIGEELGEDFYIIPSSIHEVLVLPEHCVGDVEEVNSLIAQINKDHVIPEDILSGRAYFYKRNEKRFYF